MTLHTGSPYQDRDVTLSAPVARLILAAGHADDVRESVKGWLRRAEMDEDIYYFSIHADEELVGQIFLHDIDETAGEALVGYHLFDYQARGRGVGTKALQLLQRFVQTETTLKRLILITSADNAASRRAAEKASFTYVGSPREDPTGVLLTWSTCPSPNQP